MSLVVPPTIGAHNLNAFGLLLRRHHLSEFVEAVDVHSRLCWKGLSKLELKTYIPFEIENEMTRIF